MFQTMKKTLIAVALISMTTGAALAATGAKTGVNGGAKAADGAANHKGEAAALSVQLARYGDKNKDALAMIMAARLQTEAGFRDTKLDKEGKPTESAKKATDNSTKALLERAKQYAGDRKDVLAMADDVAQSSSRGRVEGPFRGQTVVRGGVTDVIKVTLEGGDQAVIAISGDGDSDLDLYVLDENGNQVCRSVSNGDDEICRFTPKWTGKFTVKVKNNGKTDNKYQLMFN